MIPYFELRTIAIGGGRSIAAFGVLVVVGIALGIRFAQSRARVLGVPEREINVAMATWLLGRIVASYRTNHPTVPNLQPDWTNPRFVELLTFGWNAGYSEAGGVGRVARHLEERGETDLTIDLVHEQAKAAGASKHLARADKVNWCKSVAALYARELASARLSTS